jgi:membrane-bound serine protease (ClpP class)
MLGSLVWSMADIWPNQPVTIRDDLFLRPMQDLGLGMVVAVGLALALARFIPKGWFFSRLAVSQPVAGAAQFAGVAPEIGAAAATLVGRTAVAATGLYPSGQVEIDGRRYEARLEVGSAAPGARVVVRRKTDFGLVVDREEDSRG